MKKVWLIAIACLLLGNLTAKAGPVKVWFYGTDPNCGTCASTNITGTAVTNLTQSADFPASYDQTQPGGITALTGLDFPGFTPGRDNYGSFVRGYIVAPLSGAYTFFIDSDDASELWLSTDHTVANRRRIASQPTCCTGYQEDGIRSSTNTTLVKGQKYYFEIYHKEGGGGDFFRVGWRLPSGTLDRPISARHIADFPAINPVDPASNQAPDFGTAQALQPVSVNVEEFRNATFEAAVSAAQPATWQWFRIPAAGGSGIAIAGANLQYFTVTNARVSQSGERYYATVNNAFGSATSDSAALVVDPDTTSPTIVSSSTRGNPNGVVLFFSEDLRQDATNNFATKFSMNNGFTITSVRFFTNASSIAVTYSPAMAIGTTNILTLTGVPDLGGNTISTTVEVAFPDASAAGTIHFARYEGIGGTAVANLTNNANFPGNPTFTTNNLVRFQDPTPDISDFGSKLFGVFKAPISGAYNFAVSADDGAVLFISTDASAANKRVVASEPAWNNANDFTGTDRRNATAPENRSTTLFPGGIQMVAGQLYYMEGLIKEGGGGNNFSAAVQFPGGPAIANGTGSIIDGTNFITSYVINGQPIARLGPVAFTRHPSNTTTLQNRSASFSAEVDGTANPTTGGFAFQWYSNNVAILGATAKSYTLPRATATAANAQFYVVAANEFSSATSSVAVLTVILDQVIPTVVSVGTLNGSSIGVCFNEALDPATATNAANYRVNGVAPVSAILRPDGVSVELIMGTAATGNITVVVNNVSDEAGNPVAANSTQAGVQSGLISRDVGQPGDQPPYTNPVQPGSVFVCADGSFEVLAGGTDIWDAFDGFHFVYTERNTDFDVKVNVLDLEPVNRWAKAGIMVRENFTAGSKMLHNNMNTGAEPTQDGSGDGSNSIETNWRAFQDKVLPGAPGTHAALQIGAGQNPTSGTAWLRVRRVGNTFHSYRSTNGFDWIRYGTINFDTNQLQDGYPIQPLTNVYLGLATTSHNNDNDPNRLALAKYANYGDLVYSNAVITISQQPVSMTATQNTRATFTVAASVTGAPTNELYFQWTRNGINIPGAISASYTTPFLTAADNNSSYQVAVYAPGRTNLSSAAVLTVQPDVTKPVLTALEVDIAALRLSFNEPLNPTIAQDVTRYQLTPQGGSMVNPTVATINSVGTTVTLEFTPVLGADYTLAINGLQDLSGNIINTVSSNFTAFSKFVDGGVFIERWNNIGGTTVAMLTNSTRFLEPADMTMNATAASTPNAWGENYGARLRSHIIPTVTGNYTFYAHSDDSSAIFIGTNASFQGMRVAAVENGCCAAVPGVVGNTYRLEAGRAYSLLAYVKEGGGGDYLNVYWLTPGSTTAEIIPTGNLTYYINENNSVVTITQNPASQTVVEGRTATLSGNANGSSDLGNAVTFQWLLNGTPVPSATGRSYTTPALTTAENNSMYQLVASVPGQSVTSSVAVITVIDDTNAPTVISVGSIGDGSTVAVCFSEPVNAATAGNAANYSISGGRTATTATVSADGRRVILGGLSAPVTGSFTVTVQNVDDPFGNIAPSSTVGGSVLALTGLDIGAPTAVGSSTSCATNEITVVAGGADIWGNADQFHFTYEQATGDFDKIVKVASIPNNANDSIKAGLMVRETLDAGSKTIHTIVMPPAPGRNIYETGFRETTGGGTGGWGAPGAPANGNYPATHPNSWVRLQRIGNVFSSFVSSNGVDWVLNGQTTQVYPAQVFIGLASTAHNNADPAAVITYQNYGNFVAAAMGARLTAVKGPNNTIVISWPVSAGGTLESTPVLPATTWTPVTGVTQSGGQNVVTNSAATGNRFYRVRQ